MSFDVDVRLRRGDRVIASQFATGPGITALLGPSGVGKTSVLLAVAGLLTPDAGHIAVNGERLFDATTNRAPHLRRCGFIFQDVRLFPHLTVAANLRYAQRRDRGARPILAFEDLVAFLGIDHLLARTPRTLSGGEAQRVAIGRALLAAPQFLLMDEPLTALDPDRRSEVIGLIERIRATFGLPVLLVSHDRGDVARLADHIVEML